MKVIKKKNNKNRSTDLALLVESISQNEILKYDEDKVVESIISEIELNEKDARRIAKSVTTKLRKIETDTISTSLIRSFVNVELYNKGISKELKSDTDFVMPFSDLESVIYDPNNENGNTSHNPESINLSLAERVFKEYSLKKVFSKEVADAHLNSHIAIHDLGFLTRFYCSGHSIEYIKMNGLKNIPNITSSSAPANSAWVLARHLCSITQFYTSLFAGAIGQEGVNFFFAPYIIGWNSKKLKQLAQTMIFDLSQLAGAKGGQVSFTDFNVYVDIPNHYKETYAVGKGGKFMVNIDGEINYVNTRKDADNLSDKTGGKILKYKDFEKESKAFLMAILEVIGEGDSHGLPFAFPKINMHINNNSFKSEESIKVLKKACESSSKKGCPYFIFDRNAFSVSQCCFDESQKTLTKSSNGINDLTFKELYEGKHADVKNNFKIFNSGNWTSGKVIKVPRNNKKMYKVTTANNKELFMTEDHINFTFEGDKPTNLLSTSDYIGFNVIASEPTKERDMKLTYEQGVFVGAYLGDGSRPKNENHNSIDFSINSEKYIILKPLIDKAIIDLGIENVEMTLGKQYNNVYPCKVCHETVREFLDFWIKGHYCNEKRLNLESILQSKEFRKGILDGYYITDGGNSNRIYTTSKGLVEDIEVLMTSLGIISIIDISDRTGDGNVVIRGQEFNRNFPVYCIRFYNHNYTRTAKDIYKKKQNTIFFKVKNIEEILYYDKEYVYCFEMEDKEDPYFTLPNGVHTGNCRLQIQFDDDDKKLTSTPEHLRFVGVQNVSINLPNTALSTNSEDEFYEELKKRMRLACDAHITKRDYVKELAFKPNSPLKFYREGMDGKPYVDFNKGSYLIGIIGLNECVYNLIGQELHESIEAFEKGMEIIIFMNEYKTELSKEYSIKLALEETPAESKSHSLAKLDRKHFGDKAFVKEDSDGIYYTNSVHFAIDSDVDYIHRIIHQSKYHPYVDAGSMIHTWGGENKPNPDAIYNLVKKIWEETETSQWVLSPEYTKCTECNQTFNGIYDKCPKCDGNRVKQMTRITGYYVLLENWNDGKKAEFTHRKREGVK